MSIAGLRRVGIRPWLYDLDISTVSANGLRVGADRVHALSAPAIRAVAASVPLGWGVEREELSTIADLLFVRTEGVEQRLRAAADDNEKGAAR